MDKDRELVLPELFKKPQILVLDEATSSLDVDTEKEIMKSINSLVGTLTIIAVSHRYSTLADCKKNFLK